MKKILLIAATHGDEKIGIEVINNLIKKGYREAFDFIIANPQAFQKNVRFIDFDLNRAYPGSKFSKLYEKRLAYRNLKIAKQYLYIIDLHEASTGINDFIIVPRRKLSRVFPIELINLKKVLLWPDPTGPLSQILKNAIELEFGMKNRNRKRVVDKATKIMEGFIKNLQIKNPLYNKKEVYLVYGKLLSEANRIDLDALKDFKKINLQGEEFYPLLVGQYLKEGITCYKMKRRGNFRRKIDLEFCLF